MVSMVMVLFRPVGLLSSLDLKCYYLFPYQGTAYLQFSRMHGISRSSPDCMVMVLFRPVEHLVPWTASWWFYFDRWTFSSPDCMYWLDLPMAQNMNTTHMVFKKLAILRGILKLLVCLISWSFFQVIGLTYFAMVFSSYCFGSFRDRFVKLLVWLISWLFSKLLVCLISWLFSQVIVLLILGYWYLWRLLSLW